MTHPDTVPARISLVTIGVTDLAKATAFYRAIGWPQVLPAEADVSFFRTAGAILSLYGLADLAADAQIEAGPVPEGLKAGRSIAINVASPAEVDAALALAEAAGGTLVKPGQQVFWGGYSGYFADPEGNLWEVAHNPFWPLDERGLPLLPQAESDGDPDAS
ncbi:VOC family protein [Actinospica durhamensis]|uniref:VOC family protein n=1 Tax=Actinospica durhamensis TaxID=1508375 RepID=A0A941ERQ7_9ACTN|nr:VOC family protein [Actinospica durhamensis]MBR7835943.1 VOC family protein [Actinospica durhamensis]